MKEETRVGLFILAAIGIFLYLSINIRAFRFDSNHYYEYKAYFDDTGGVAPRAVIRIAGVEVGWVDSIRLLAGGQAEMVLRINRKIKLAKNAYAMVSQDGLIGTKNVEIDPGDPSTGIMLPGSTLSMPGKTPTSVGELLEQFRGIAMGIQDITASFKRVFSSRQGEENMQNALGAVAKASDRLADFSMMLQRTMDRNEQNIDLIVSDLKDTIGEFKRSVPSVTKDVHDISTSFQENASKAGNTFEHVTGVADEAKGVFGKINSGQGTVGKLINEDETYGDIKKSIRGIKDYVTRSQRLMLNVDMHSETMLRHTNSKGYFELKFRPNSDFFYTLQLVADEKGSVTRKCKFITRRDDKGCVLRASELDIPLERKVQFPDQIETIKQKKDDILFGFQFGKRFDRLAFRIGLFENTFGFGVDFYVPLKTDKVHWITSLDAFDFRGRNRIHDGRAHVKWLNRIFFFKNMYTTFGLDDFFSKHNANPFFGGGFRFGDDDLKYFLSSLPIGSLAKK